MPGRRAAVLLLLMTGALAPMASEAESPIGSSQRPPGATPVVLDSNGSVLGPLVGSFLGLGVVRVPAPGRSVLLMVAREALVSLFPTQFVAVDCAGPALVESPMTLGQPLISELATVGPLGEVRVTDGSANVTAIRSELRTVGDPLGCHNLGSPEFRLVHATTVLPLGPFVPPLRLPDAP